MAKKIFFSVGEASGDLYASIVIRQLINQGIKPSNIYAIGGAKIRETGIQIIRDISDLGVFGFSEGISSYFRIKKIYNKTKKMLEVIKPDIFIPVAFAGFNLPLVKFAHHLNIKVIYFVPPQLWAWGKFRSRMLKKYCAKVICLFPFEQNFYSELGIKAIYLGNPLIDYVKTHFTKQEVARLLNFDNQSKWLSFMPGSRPSEINVHLPLMVKIIKKLQEDYKDIYRYFILTDQPRIAEQMKHEAVFFGTDYKYEIMANSDLILLASGTASLESALLGVPHIAIYRLSALTFLFAKSFLNIKTFALPNILLQKIIVPEFAQPNFSEVYDYCSLLLSDASARTKITNALQDIKNILGPTGASIRIAQEILQ